MKFKSSSSSGIWAVGHTIVLLLPSKLQAARDASVININKIFTILDYDRETNLSILLLNFVYTLATLSGFTRVNLGEKGSTA